MTRSRGFVAAAGAALILVGTIVVAAIVWTMGHHRGTEVPAANVGASSAPSGVPTAIVRESIVEQTIHVSGRVGPAAGPQSKLSFSVPGTVARVDVRLGQRVDAGTPLAQVDATAYELSAQQAGADAQAAAATAAGAAIDRLSVKLRVDRAELSRQQRLYAAGIVALRDVEAARAALAADSAETQTANAQRAAASAQARSANAHSLAVNYDLERTTLRAPRPGIVTGIFVQPGDSVDTTIPAIALTPALTHVATLDVPVNDVPQIVAGDRVRAYAASAGGVRFDARVAGVAPAVNPATGLATIDIGGVPPNVPAGTPVDATVVVGQARGLVVPREAIVEDPENGNTLVFVRTRARDGSMRFASRVVRVGGTDDRFVRIVAGVRAGERVAAQGAIDLLAP
jgi:cobalt-zinc-cadmium efflux system membrane fusion protein